MKENNLKELPIKPILGVPIFIGTKKQLLETISRHISQEDGIVNIFTPNPEQLSMSFHDAGFRKILEQSDINIPDGQGIVWALSRLGVKGIRRIPGRVMFEDLLSVAVGNKWRVFFLGGKPGSAAYLANKYGFQSSPGAKDISRENQKEKEAVLSQIKDYKPQMVFVAYGAPWQEKWVEENRDALQRAGVKLVMVVGGSFDYLAGLVPQVPTWVEQSHLEWLWRLFGQPWRWKRQLKGLEFFMRILLGK